MYDNVEYVGHNLTGLYYGVSLIRASTGSSLSLMFPQGFTPQQAYEFINTYYATWQAQYFL